MSRVTTCAKPGVALWFRYGPGTHAQLFPALPHVLRMLSDHAEVHYFGMRGGPADRDVVPDAVRVHWLPWSVKRQSGGDKWIKTLLWLAALPLMGHRCQRLGIRLIFMDETLPLSTLLARVFYRGMVVTTVADFFATIYGERRFGFHLLARAVNAMDLWSWRRLPLVFTKTRAARDYLLDHGLDAERVTVTYNPCDLKLFRPGDRLEARREFSLGPDDYVAVHHGVMHPNKGNEFLIRALSPVMKGDVRVKLLLIGDGPEMPRLRRLVDSLGLARQVLMTGWLSTPEHVSRGLTAADVGLAMRIGQFSDHFHVTDTLVHELACGLPVLAARLGGMAEILEGSGAGDLFDPADENDFRAKFTRLMNDPGLRSGMSAAARRCAESKFDPASIARQTVESLRRVM